MNQREVEKIGSPEFINLQKVDISPLMSSCQIKVMYIGKNDNNTFISKETALEMAKTLRGAPIVGYFKEDVEDFGDHGQEMVIDDEGIKFNIRTKPYGFVAPDTEVWFQKFRELDRRGLVVEREYLMTNGFLWNGQFEEANLALDGRPQSMELDPETIKGEWTKDYNSDVEFFIINDATFSKLCILGDDVEPCFEGASVKRATTNFTKDNGEFTKTLFTMMQELREYTKSNIQKGGEGMENEKIEVIKESDIPVVEKVNEVETEKPVEENKPDTSITNEVEAGVVPERLLEGQPAQEENKENIEVPVDTEKPTEVVEPVETKEKDITQEYEALQNEYSLLEEKFNSVNEELTSLREYKRTIDNKAKDEMIYNTFGILSDEEKANVIENKENFTLEQIEEKLSVIAVRKQVNLGSTNDSKNQESIEGNANTSYNLENTIEEDNVPEFVKKLKLKKQEKNF